MPRYRAGFNLGGIIVGAVPPIIAGPLMALLVGVSLAVTYLLSETRGVELRREGGTPTPTPLSRQRPMLVA